MTDGPTVLMDSVEAGAELNTQYPGGGMPAQAVVPLPAGGWKIRAIHTETEEGPWVGLVQLMPVDD